MTDGPARVGVATFAWAARAGRESAFGVTRKKRQRDLGQPRPGGEDRPIDPAVAHTPVYLALEDANFLAEHHQLDVLVEPSSA